MMVPVKLGKENLMTRPHARTSRTRLRRGWTPYIVVAGVCLAMLSPGLHAHATVTAVPAELEVPAGHTLLLQARAVGTQNYICLLTPSGFAWTFFGPQATLFQSGRQITTHFLSPNPDEGDLPRATWQHSRDSSRVWAKAVASSSDPYFVEPGAIPWLLLEVVGAELGPTPAAGLTQTVYIQRIHTSGGLAPATGCDDQAPVGARALVPYEADYLFYRPTIPR